LAAGQTFLLGLEGAVVVGGGVPIVMDGKIVGAIGVSGGEIHCWDEVGQGSDRFRPRVMFAPRISHCQVEK